MRCAAQSMRAFRVQTLRLLPSSVAVRSYGGPNGGRPPMGPSNPGGRYPRGGGPPPPDRRNTLNEPQIIAALIKSFPGDNAFIPINKWASSLPDDLREALVRYGGLGAFATAQTNFFIVRRENGVTLASLSSMGSGLVYENKRKELQEQKRAEKDSKRRSYFAPRDRDRDRDFSSSRRGPPRR